jgi:hypothetical protein
VFREAYGKQLDAGRMALYVIYERLAIWSYFGRPGVRAEWLRGRTFCAWAQRYVDGVLNIL